MGKGEQVLAIFRAWAGVLLEPVSSFADGEDVTHVHACGLSPPVSRPNEFRSLNVLSIIPH
jgi:hypothetical protein